MQKTSTEVMASAHFLIVDDQAFLRSLLQGMLVGLGAHNIRSAANGEEALQKLSQNKVSCVISDWNMTPVNGLDLLQKIRTGYLRGIPANLPFILFTAHGSSSVVTTALNLDVSACLVKPASAQGLGKAINAAMSKQLIAKPSSFYARIEITDSPNQEGGSPVRKASDWAKWVKQGKPEYFDTETSHINRSGLDVTDGPEPDGPVQLRNIRHKALGAIQVGQVLVEDFNDDDGVALLVAGTLITEKILTRLRAIDEKRSEKLKLWVGRLK